MEGGSPSTAHPECLAGPSPPGIFPGSGQFPLPGLIGCSPGWIKSRTVKLTSLPPVSAILFSSTAQVPNSFSGYKGEHFQTLNYLHLRNTRAFSPFQSCQPLASPPSWLKRLPSSEKLWEMCIFKKEVCVLFPPIFPVAKKRSKMKPHFSSKAHLGYLGGRGQRKIQVNEPAAHGGVCGEREGIYFVLSQHN